MSQQMKNREKAYLLGYSKNPDRKSNAVNFL